MARVIFQAALALVAGGLLSAPQVTAQQAGSAGGIPVSLVVTVEARHGKEIPVIHREDVMVHQGHDRMRVTDWLPLEGERGALHPTAPNAGAAAAPALELFLLIDDTSNTELGLQLQELRKFIGAQPATTAVGVGYMRNGMVDIVRNFTTDHAAAANSLRLPLGAAGASGSPYLSVMDLIKRWPAKAPRREILMISHGIDPLGGGAANPYLDEAVEKAQQAGVVVYALYAGPTGHYGHSLWRTNWGQNHLSRIAEETGGEAYFQGFQAPIDYTPYLEDLSGKLNHQYRLTFLAKAGKKAGFQPVKVTTEVPNTELVAAGKVYVPAAQ